MALSLTKDAPPPELNGTIEIGVHWDRSDLRSEWNHSCTSQCSNPCTVNRLDLRPVMQALPGVDPDDPDNKPVIPRIPSPRKPGEK